MVYFKDERRYETMSGPLRLFGGQRGRALIPRGGGHRGDQRAHGRRQLDGGPGGGDEPARHVPRIVRPHAARLKRERERR